MKLIFTNKSHLKHSEYFLFCIFAFQGAKKVIDSEEFMASFKYVFIHLKKLIKWHFSLN